MRILHLTAGSDSGGVSRYIFDLCTALRSQGHEVAVAGERGRWHERFAAAPWPWIDAPLKAGPVGLIRAVRILRGYLRDHPVDLIHTHFRKAAIVGRRLQRAQRPPLLYTLHGSHIPLGGFWGWMSDFGDRVHVPSSEAREWLISSAHVPTERIALIPHGLHVERFPVASESARAGARAVLGFGPDDLVALYLGRLEFQKNEEWMIDLAEASKDRLPQLRIVMAGEGPHEADVAAAIRQRNLGSRIQLLGHREPLPVLHAADALLLPSLREGFSYACAEAMCAGVPVLRTRTSGTRELIVEGVTGRSVDIDRDAFVRGSIEFLSDRASLRQMGLNASRHIREHFTFDRQLSQTIELYQDMFSRAGES